MMQSGETANIEETGRVMLRQRLWELACQGVSKSIAEYREYRKLLALWHEEKI